MTSGTGDDDQLSEIDRFDDGVGWMAHPGEDVQRASHALATDAGVVVVDPVDAPGLDDLLAPLGDVAAVAVLLDRHERDAVQVAERHDVPVAAPGWMRGVEGRAGGGPTSLSEVLAGTDYEVRKLLNTPVWREAALHDPVGGTLVVPESLGTSPFFRTRDERVGVHPVLRLTPPRSLRGVAAERLLVGHGEGVMTEAASAIDEAIRGSRVRSPRLLVDNVKGLLLG